MADVFKQRRDTAANFTSINPKLEDGQFGVETDTLKMKFGDGVTVWTGLSYITSQATLTVTTGITASATQAQGNGLLTSQVNEVDVVGTDGDNVTLTPAIAGEICVVFNNDSAQALRIFPLSGDDLGAGLNLAMSIDLAPGDMVIFYAYDTTNWRGFVPASMVT